MISERNSESKSLTTCTACIASIPATRIPIECESEGRATRELAEYPRCKVLVHPE